MTDKWEIWMCNTEELWALLDEGWEPYSTVWSTIAFNKRTGPTEELKHFLKRKKVTA